VSTNNKGGITRGKIDRPTIDRGSTRGRSDKGNIDRGNIKGNISDCIGGNFLAITVNLIAKIAQRSALERPEEELVDDNFSPT